MPKHLHTFRRRRTRPVALLVVGLLAASPLSGATGASGSEEPTGKIVGAASVKAAVPVPMAGDVPAEMRPAPTRAVELSLDDVARRRAAAAAAVAFAEATAAVARAELAERATDGPTTLAELARRSAAMVRGIPLDTEADARRRLELALVRLADATRTQVELEAALARWVGLQDTLTALRPGAMTVAVLGPSALTAEELASWFVRRTRTDRTPIGTAHQLAAGYLAVGDALGVRGDVAFVQAAHETGYFTSGHAKRFNLAGIGAFDSCSPSCGVRFPSLDEGIRGHLALMHDYAVAERKLSPLSPPGLAGCCPTWVALAKRWATGPTYAETVLGQYRDAVRWAADGHTIPTV